ncbi:primosomal protein N' [Couchioplanes azureus]|uniref:primosomal protein N' n=1 Tax=Couchioplanes caeruleus TaxID=56438 RepID=UPI0016701CEB|nr:primosomal protein N' [Couchioplanes caeruleus]
MATKGGEREPAATLPVGRVCVDVPLPHLDRPFDYLVSAADDAAAQPGVRVKVRFAGQMVSGFLLERVDSSSHAKLAYVDKVVSPERVLDPEIARLARAIADRYSGNLPDVLRLAVPPRHARVEAESTPAVATRAATTSPAAAVAPPTSAAAAVAPTTSAAAAVAPTTTDAAAAVASTAAAIAADAGIAAAVAATDDAIAATGTAAAETTTGAAADPVGPPGPDVPAGLVASADAAAPGGRAGSATFSDADGGSGWGAYRAGVPFLRALAQGRAARAVWSALPGEDWPARIAEAAAATVRAGRGVVVVVADARDLDRLDRALTAALGDGRHVALHAAAGPSERYRRFLAASRHQVPVVAGTRAAMFAPVADLGLVVIWDDGDDLHAEPRAPYPHAREVLLTRAQLAGCAALVGGFARTGEAQLLLETGWAKEITASRDVLRARCPVIAPTGDDPQLARDPGAVTARLPSLAWQTARQALQSGAPVLVQVPRRGYLPSVACAECRTPARCPHCSGPLGLAGARSVPACHWCGRAAAAYACPACGGRRLRASVTGARRTAEELGRAFPGVPVRTSGRDEILDTVPGDAAVVVATPGAEPIAEGGYGAVLLLDTWALLTRADLRAAEETMRRWLSAAALARPGPAGGRVVVVADGSLAPVQALLRWDPGWFAARELAERRELRFPPAARFASLTGRAEAVAELLAAARLPGDAEVLGPVPAPDEQERMLVRVSRSHAAALARALHEAAAVRSAKKAALPVRVQIDPAELL